MISVLSIILALSIGLAVSKSYYKPNGTRS